MLLSAVFVGPQSMWGFVALIPLVTGSVGGAALVFGIETRVVRLALISVLLWATWVHAGNGWLFSAQGGGWQFPLFRALVQVAIAHLGRGAFALRLPIINKPLGQFA